VARVLDACCCAGGMTRGYVLAGHEVHGSDITFHRNYLKSGAASFIQADVLDLLADRAFLAPFDLVSVSPPCQRDSVMSFCRPGLAATYPDLVSPVRELLEASGKPWVIEQPERGGRMKLRNPVTLCAWTMGRELYRHRSFETGGGFRFKVPVHSQHTVPASRAGHWVPGTIMSVAGHIAPVAHARKIMELYGTTREELAEAVPPYMARFIGEQI
jgi:DNA (cytosine-5)-methyltransferase 1